MIIHLNSSATFMGGFNMADSSFLPLYLRSVMSINHADLEEIKHLQEGWFVEFKERLPDLTKLARSISSFANSHGGLLVIGVREDQKTRRFAEFAPMTREIADLCLTRVREAIASHISPPPYFEARAVHLKATEEVEKDNWIVLISIPKGKNAPYLHSSGCIYVRLGDSASPFALSDLAQQERLWSISLHRKDRIKNRIEELSKEFQVGVPSIHVVALADGQPLTGSRKLSYEDFSKIARDSHLEHGSELFDHVQTLDTSFLARRTEKNIKSHGVLWDYDYRRRLHFIKIPISTHTWSNGSFDVNKDLFGLDQLASRLAASEANNNLMVANLLPSAYFLSIVIHKVKRIHEIEGYSGGVQLNARAVDVKGLVPFIATPNYFKEFDEIGLPFVLREIGFIRPLEDPASWIAFDASIKPLDADIKLDIDLVATFSAFSFLAQSMGISRYVSLGALGSDNDAFDIDPLSELFAQAHSTSFSIMSHHNPNSLGADRAARHPS